MMNESGVRTWAWLLGRAALAVVAYHVGILVAVAYALAARSSVVQVPLHFAFLLVPLQVIYHRRGAADFVRVSLLAVALLAVFRLALAASALGELAGAGAQNEMERALAPLPGVIFPWIAVEIVTVLALIAGLAWVNIYGPAYVKWRATYRILAATAGSSVLALLTIALLAANHGFVESMKQLLTNVMGLFRTAAQQAEVSPPPLPDASLIMRAFWEYLFGSFVFGYFVNLAGAWYVGGRIAARSRLGAAGSALAGFALPEVMVWPLIGSWAVVLAGRFAPLGYLRVFALNAGLVILALYGVQGLAIVESLIARKKRAVDAGRYLLVGLLVVLVVPALTILALVVLPLVGVSEIWVQYRVERKERSDEGEGDP
jgi:hypothetical protein